MPFYNTGGNGTYYYNNTVASDPAITYNILRGLHMQQCINQREVHQQHHFVPGHCN